MITLLLLLALDALPWHGARFSTTTCRAGLAYVGDCYDSTMPTRCWALAEYFCSAGRDVTPTGLPHVPITWPDEWHEHGVPDGQIEEPTPPVCVGCTE